MIVFSLFLIVKRQLPVSPLASPLMKEKHVNTEDEEDDEEEGSLNDGPAPLLLADLQSEVVDMTTSHTYFPQYSSPVAHMDDLPPHPLHSLFTTSSPWRPNQHSTMLQLQRPPNHDHQNQLTTITETPSAIPAAPVYSSTAIDSCVMNCQDSAFSSCFHPTRSGLGLLDSVCPQSSMKAKLPDASLMEMSQQEDSGVLDTGHSRTAEKTKGLSSEVCTHGAVPTPLTLQVARPTTFAPFSRSTPVPWITSAKLNLPHAPFPSPFTLHTNILPPRLRITGSSPTRIVAPNQYSPRAESSSPLSDELLRRKAYLKAKLKYSK